MTLKSYFNDMKQKKFFMFGIIWGLIAAAFSSNVETIILALEEIADALLGFLIWGMALPGVITRYIPFIQDNTFLVIGGAVAIAIILSPIAYRIFDFIRNLFKKIPW